MPIARRPHAERKGITMAHRAPRTNAPGNFRFRNPFHNHLYLSPSNVSKKIYFQCQKINKPPSPIKNEKTSLQNYFPSIECAVLIDSGRAVSSAVEHRLHTAGVTGSKPVSRTILYSVERKMSILRGAFFVSASFARLHRDNAPHSRH